VRIGVEAWGTDYGSEAAFSGPEGVSVEEVDTSCETTDWAPIDATPDEELLALPVGFVDGTRRIDARLFVSDNGLAPSPGVAGSVGVGAVLCEPGPPGPNGRRTGAWRSEKGAEIAEIEVRRYLVMGEGGSLEMTAGPGLEFEALSHPGSDEAALVDTVHDRMRAMEAAMAQSLAGDGRVMFVDGPLAVMRPGAARVVGFIKAHHKRYLDEDHEVTLSRLGCGQRTPLFSFGDPRPRYSWYLRLCDLDEHHHNWHGVVRCETPAALSVAEAIRMADVSAALLPAFASQEGWDPRAPQNLVPIAGLERHLRHLLGDRDLITRMITSAARAMSEGGERAAG
jgi:hypothetical protein